MWTQHLAQTFIPPCSRLSSRNWQEAQNTKNVFTQKHPPIAIDLDGTFVREHSLWHCHPKKWTSWLYLYWPLIKHSIAKAPLVLEELHIHEGVYETCQFWKKEGRFVILITGSPMAIAKKIALQASCFDLVVSSSPWWNLVGRKKAWWLCQHFGPQGFDYIGNSLADIPVWKKARKGYCVAESASCLPTKILKILERI